MGSNTALQKTSQQVRSIAKAPSLSKLERELARVEKQAIKDGDSLVALQKKLEEMQVYRGIGNPLTNAGVDSAIKKTEAQIKELSAAVDNADSKIRSLRQSIQTATTGTSAPIQKTVQQVKAAAPAVENVSRATKTVKTTLDNASKSAKRLGDTVKKAGTSGAGGMGGPWPIHQGYGGLLWDIRPVVFSDRGYFRQFWPDGGGKRGRQPNVV